MLTLLLAPLFLSAEPASLCKPGEEVLFSCATEGAKQLSVCGRAEKRETMVRFRVGTPLKLELDFAPRDSSAYSVLYDHPTNRDGSTSNTFTVCFTAEKVDSDFEYVNKGDPHDPTASDRNQLMLSGSMVWLGSSPAKAKDGKVFCEKIVIDRQLRPLKALYEKTHPHHE